MKPQIFFRSAAWLLVLATGVFTLAPIDLRPGTGSSVDLERFVPFALIGAAFYLGYPKHRVQILMLVIAIVAILEFSQNYVPGRHGRLSDAFMKVSGALAGAAFVALLTRHKRFS